MGGFASALGRGLSQAGYAAGEYFGKAALFDIQNEAEMQRQLRLQEIREAAEIRSEERKVKMADEERTKQTARIDAKTGQLADEQVSQKRSQIESGIVDRSLWTAEMQDAADQSLAEDRKKLARDPKLRTEAAIATGDIAPKDAAVLTQKDDAAMWKQLWEMAKEEGRDRRFTEQQDRIDARQSKQLAAMFERLEKRDAKNDKANSLQSTQVDGNGYLVGVFRDGTTKRMTDPDGNPITSQSFEQRVDRVANSLRKEGDSKFRKMPEEELRAHVRRTLISSDGGKPSAPSPAPAPTPRPAASASKSRPPLSSFERR